MFLVVAGVFKTSFVQKDTRETQAGRPGKHSARPWAGALDEVRQFGGWCKPHSLGPPVVPFYPFLGEGSPTKIDYRKKVTLILTSLLEDLAPNN